MNEPSTSGICGNRSNIPKFVVDKRCLSLLKQLKSENTQLKSELTKLQSRYDVLLNQENTAQSNIPCGSVANSNNEKEKLIKINLLDKNKTNQQICSELVHYKQLCDKYNGELARKDQVILLLKKSRSNDSNKELKTVCEYQYMLKKLKANVDVCYKIIEEQESKITNFNETVYLKTKPSVQQQVREEEENCEHSSISPTSSLLLKLTERVKALQLQNQMQSQMLEMQPTIIQAKKLLEDQLSAKQIELEKCQKHAKKKNSQLQEEIESLHNQNLQLKKEKDEQKHIYEIQNKTFQDDFNEERNEKQKAYEELHQLKKMVSDTSPVLPQQHYRPQPPIQQKSHPPTQMLLTQDFSSQPAQRHQHGYFPSTSHSIKEGTGQNPGNNVQYIPTPCHTNTVTFQDQRERATPAPHIGYPTSNHYQHSTSPHQQYSLSQHNMPNQRPLYGQQQGSLHSSIQHDTSNPTSKDAN